MALLARMAALDITEEEIVEKFILGSGKGGQKVNKTASCVYIKHIPTGIEIKSQKSRGRELNRFYVRRLLCDKIEEIKLGKASRKQQEIEKIRRQKRKRSKRAKEKVLADKSKKSDKKVTRKMLVFPLRDGDI
ncbi:MAG: peptide chain release factor-like protein [Candidatus Margulisbacteria bacterium]|nr:peptide chain release factor-like protein [Candidatus Margulisiibacteriota bacterium]